MSQWTAADLPSFAGRTVIVTGANSGLGEVTARELARVGAEVILAVRNTTKGNEAAEGMTGDIEVCRTWRRYAPSPTASTVSMC
jgi:NAD(P)-dependent dehydrogenase (short-subunit alcohol dehydrogenase family)